MKKVLVGCGILVGVCFLALFVALAAIGHLGPETKVVPGPQTPKRFVATIHELELLEPGEQIRFFYSDALLDIKGGLYLLTDRKLVVYSDDFAEPKRIVPFAEVADLDVTYSDSFWDDSQIRVTTEAGDDVWFPLSSEGGGDHRFFEALEAAQKQARGGTEDAPPEAGDAETQDPGPDPKP